MLPMKGMASCELHKAVKGRGRGKFKGFKHEKPKHKEQENAPIGNLYVSSSRYNDHHSVKETLQDLENGNFDGEYIEIYQMSLFEQEKKQYIFCFSILLNYDQITCW